MPVMIQNVFMYTDSIISNSLVLVFKGELDQALSSENLRFLFASSGCLESTHALCSP